MAIVGMLSVPARSESPLPRSAMSRSKTPSRCMPGSINTSRQKQRPQSLVRGRAEGPAFRTTTAMAPTASAETDPNRTDCFSTLGLAPTASTSEIRQAYRTLAKQHHPDSNPSPTAPCKFVEVRSAYEMCLAKEVRRSQSVPSPSAPQRKNARQAATSNNSSPARTQTSGRTQARRTKGRRDAWDDIWEEMLSSPQNSRRRR